MPISVRPQTRGLRAAHTAGRRQSGQSGGKMGSNDIVAGVVGLVEAHAEERATLKRTATAKDKDGDVNEGGQPKAIEVSSVHTWPHASRLHSGRLVVAIHKRSQFL